MEGGSGSRKYFCIAEILGRETVTLFFFLKKNFWVTKNLFLKKKNVQKKIIGKIFQKNKKFNFGEEIVFAEN